MCIIGIIFIIYINFDIRYDENEICKIFIDIMCILSENVKRKSSSLEDLS